MKNFNTKKSIKSYALSVKRVQLYLLLILMIIGQSIYSQNPWIQLGNDIEGEAANDWSGMSVSMSSDGSTVAIGAPFNDANAVGGGDAGHVRVYRYLNNAWTQIGSDIDGEAAMNGSGYSVSLSSNGSIVAIGAPFNGNTIGHVRIYQFSNNTWTQLGSDIDGEAVGDYSGLFVSLSTDGSTVAIGAPNNDGGGNDAGHVRVYRYISNSWTQLGSDIDGEAAGDWCGSSVSLNQNGNTVAIGAPKNAGNGTDAGHVRVYRYISNAWVKIGNDIDGEAANDNSGSSVSVSSDGNTVAIGAIGNDGGSYSAGHVRVYTFSNNVWTQIGSDIDGEAMNDGSGGSVSLSLDGKTVAIGASGNDGTAIDAGHVRIYRYIDTIWTQTGVDIDGVAFEDLSGCSVSLNGIGNSVAIGARQNDGSATDAGHVRVYLPKPEICIVGIDSATNHNRIIFEKTLSTVDTFNIYRETTVANVYQKIGSVPYSSPGIFIDANSNPAVKAYKYKISTVDTIGIESPLSDYHRTIHLTINKGVGSAWNLIWLDGYEGFSFSSYYMYRGTDSTNMVLFDSIQSTAQSFTDLNPPNDTVYYQIEVVKATGCYPDSIFSKANTNYNSSRSNVANTMAFITPDTTGIQEIIEKNLHINIYPNPNKGIFTIDINISKRNEFVKMPIKISVYNLLGKKVYGEEIQSLGEIHKHYLNLSNLPKGIYNIQLMNDEMKQVRKVVIH